MNLKVCIVGCGKIADGHAEEIRKARGATLAAVCDIEPLMAEQLAARYKIQRHYGDFAKMLETEKPDVVHITTPPGSHPALAEAAMSAGAHVYVEKPFALDQAAGRRIVECAERTGRKLTINYWPNFEPQALELGELVAGGALGEIVHVESYFGYSLAGDFGSALLGDSGHWVHRLPGKLFHNVLDHIVNKMTPFIGEAPPRVSAMAYRRRPATGDAVIDGVLDELRFLAAGERASATGTFCAHARPVGHTLRLYGTQGTAHVDYNMRTVVVEPEQSMPSALGRLFPAFETARRYRRQARKNLRRFIRSEFHYFSGMGTLIGRFYECIRDNTAPPIAYGEILRVSGIMDEIIGQVYGKTLLAADERR